MFTEDKPQTPLEKQISRVLEDMEITDTNSEKYGELLDRLQKLHKMAQDQRPARVSPDTAIQAAASLLSILMITHYEHTDVITSKALGFVPKLR